MKTVPRVFAYLKRYPWMAAGALACAIFSTLMFIVFPAVTKRVIITSARGEAGDDLFEAAVAAERLPQGMQSQVSVTQKTRETAGDLQLIEREFLLARPRINDGQILNRERAVDRVFRHRQQLDGAPAFL